VATSVQRRANDRDPLPAAAWLEAGPATVAEQLALDEALLELAHEGLLTTACVRTWMADRPAVVLGSSCRIDIEVDRTACANAGVAILRRPSGGGTVVVGPGCLMWTVVEPHPGGAPPIEAVHAAMLEPLAGTLSAALAAAGGPARRVERRGTSDLVLAGEDVAATAERKVSGNSLRVRRHGVLYHGTLLDACDLDLVARVLRHPPREPDYRAGRSHGAFLANLGLGRRALDRAVRTAFAATAAFADWPRDRVERLVRDRYASAEWTARL
jgi:lipoate---protein ligase